MTNPKGNPKPKGETLDATTLFRHKTAEKKTWVKAAKLKSISLNQAARDALNRWARRVLGE